MSNELTNLLPFERRESLSRDYLFRVGTFACALLGVVFIVHGLLLAPSYTYVREQKGIQEQRLTELTEERAVSGFTDLTARVTAFTEHAASLEELGTLPSASDSIRAILALPRTDILLSGFTFSAPQGGDAGRMTVTGTAATREALRRFDGALNELSFVSASDLPLSAYAKERDIPFAISLTLDFTTP